MFDRMNSEVRNNFLVLENEFHREVDEQKSKDDESTVPSDVVCLLNDEVSDVESFPNNEVSDVMGDLEVIDLCSMNESDEASR